MFKSKILILSFFLLTVLFAQAQEDETANGTVSIAIPEVAIMDIEGPGSQSISLVVEAPSEAGLMLDLTAAADSSLWLNYSSVRSQALEANRSIYARIVSGSVPSGLRMRVTAGAYTGSGDGTHGIATNGKILNGNDRRIVRNIRTCYTGDGVGNGHRLVYTLEYRNNQYNRIDFDDSNTVSVLYTITDN